MQKRKRHMEIIYADDVADRAIKDIDVPGSDLLHST